MKKYIAAFLALFTIIATLGSCAPVVTPSQTAPATTAAGTEGSPSDSLDSEGTQATDKIPETPIRVAALKGPTAMGMVQLMDQSQAGLLPYDISVKGAIDEITPALLQGSVDLAAIPANLAAILYNNTKGQIQVLAINTLGVLYIVEQGESVKTVSDLKGKRIFASGKGATPEYALRMVLEAAGLDPDKDVTLEFKAEHTECLAALTANPGAIALLPQPFVTTAQLKDPSIRIAVDVNQEWEKLSGEEGQAGPLITGVLVGRQNFIQENPEAVDAFLKANKVSADFVNQNPQAAAQLMEQFDIVPAAVGEKAIPYSNITFITGQEMEQKLSSYLDFLFDQNAESVGGAVPDEGFYYYPSKLG